MTNAPIDIGDNHSVSRAVRKDETQGPKPQTPAINRVTTSTAKEKGEEIAKSKKRSRTEESQSTSSRGFGSMTSEVTATARTKVPPATAAAVGGYSTLYPAAPPGVASAHPILAPRSPFVSSHVPYEGAGGAATASDAVLHGLSSAIDEEPSPAVFARMSRSERKRYREKKRRSQVNKGFDDLMTVLLKVDPEVRAEVEEHERTRRKHQPRTTGTDGENPALNRVDLITRTIMTLEKMNEKNLEIKERLAQLSNSQGTKTNDLAAAREAIKEDRVLLMIPFLTPTGPVATRPASATNAIPTAQQQPSQPPPPQRQQQQQQQHPIGMQPVGTSTLFQDLPLSSAAYAAPQLATMSAARTYAPSHLQAYPTEENGFNHGYFRGISDASAGRRLYPDRDHMGQRGRLM